MKAKEITKMRDESVPELTIKAHKLKEDIARMSIEATASKPKNTNAIGNKRKELAQILTVINEKSE